MYYGQQALTFGFLVYVLFLLGRSARLNALSNQKMERLRAQIAELTTENDRLGYLILYEKTASFRELEARRELDIKKPGETVFVLPNEPTPQEISQTKQTTHTAPTETLLRMWWAYFFSR